MIDAANVTDTRMALVSVDSSQNPAVPFLFRSYNAPHGASRFVGSCEVPLWQALRASTAAPGYFDDFAILDRRFVDGGILYNNPSAVALHEARALWPGHPIGVLLSVGNGTPHPKRTEHSFTQTLLTVVHGATETDKTHWTLLDLLSEDVYYRLNPQDDSFEWSLDETRYERFDALDEAVDKFAEEHAALFARVAQRLLDSVAAAVKM
jgi:calcium-independent phospholipase A2-gamma